MENEKRDLKRMNEFTKSMKELRQKRMNEFNRFKETKHEDIIKMTPLEEKLEQIRYNRKRLSFAQKINIYYEIMKRMQTEEDVEKIVECVLEEKTPRRIAIKLVDKFENNQNKLVDIALGEMLYKSTEKTIRDREYKKRRMQEEFNKAMGMRFGSKKGLDYSDGDPKELREKAFLYGVYRKDKYSDENKNTK